MTYNFTTLTALTSSNSNFVEIEGVHINTIGQVVATEASLAGDAAAAIDTFVYSNGTYTLLSNLPNSNQITNTVGINNNGQVVGNYIAPLGSGPFIDLTEHGFLYSNGVSLTLTDPSAISGTPASNTNFMYNGTVAAAINDSGEVVGTYVDGTGNHGFFYNNGAYTTLDAPSATNGFGAFGFPLGTSATAINNSGQVVGDFTDATNAEHGFLYNNGTYLTLTDPLATTHNGDGTAAIAINNSGQVVGDYKDVGNNSHGFLYSNGNFISIDDPNGQAGLTFVVGINNIDQVIGNSLNASGVEQGFIFSGGTYTQISDPLGTEGTFLQSINDLGQVTGYYVDSGGSQHAFVANPSGPQTTTIQQEIAGLYAAVYNRTADASGMQYWDNIVAQQPDASGVTVASAANTPISASDASLLGQMFVSTQSAYFNQTYGNLNDSDFVNALYLNMGGQNAETSSAITYWVNVIQNGEASGLSVQNARASMVGQFVHDLIDVNLAQWTTLLTPSELETAILRQSVVDNKLAVSLAYVNASANPNGSFLNAHVVGDAAFQAEITALTGMVINPLGVSVETTAINQAVSDHNFADIQPVGILMPQPVA